MSLSDKVLLVLSLTLVGVFTVGGTLIVRRSERALIETVKNETRVVSETLASALEVLGPRDPSGTRRIQTLAEKLGRLDGIAWIEVFDSEATILAHSRPDRVGGLALAHHAALVQEVFERRVVIEEDDPERSQFLRFLPYYRPTDQGGRTMAGVIELAADMTPVHAQIGALRNRLALILAVAVALAWVALFWIFRTGVIAPLRRLTEGADRIAGGDLSIRTHSTARDEIGTLSRAFNRMIEQLESITVSREFMENILNSMQEALVIATAGGTIRTLNRSARELLGFQDSELIGRPLRDLLPSDAMRGLLPSGREDATSGPTIETTCATKGGERIPVAVTSTQLRGRPSERRGTIFAIEDLRDRIRSAEAIVDSEARHQAIVATAAEGIITIDTDGSIESMNEAGTRIFGYAAHEVIGLKVNLLMPEPYHSEHDGYLEQYLRTGERRILDARREALGRRKDGTTFPIELWISEVKLPGRRIFCAIVSDISRRKELEEQLLHAQKMEIVGTLAGGIAHDFNNLLTAIGGFGQLALDEVGRDTPVGNDISEILRAGQRASALTEQLLAFSRKQVLQPGLEDINRIVRSAERLLIRTLGEDVSLVTILDPDLVSVRVDAARMEQVILNLAVNARDAMPAGGTLTLETTNVEPDEADAAAHPQLQPGRYVMLAISDTGVGLEPDTLSHIFEPFFTTKSAGEGTGLGLAMVYETIKQSGGDVFVYSEPGEGTTFKIYLPWADPPQEAVRPEEGEPSAAETRGSETVAVVEDEPVVRRLVKRVLEEKGYLVLEAEDADEALKIFELQGAQVDLLITDVILPGMNGRELAERLTAHRPALRVLFISGYTDNIIARHGIVAEDIEFLQKPIVPSRLLTSVREALGRDAGLPEHAASS